MHIPIHYYLYKFHDRVRYWEYVELKRFRIMSYMSVVLKLVISMSGIILLLKSTRLLDTTHCHSKLSSFVDNLIILRIKMARFKSTCNHSACHLLNAALNAILGHGTVHQCGSQVDNDKFTFDFTSDLVFIIF